jgi:4-hydroxy-tetrahydrodipicolinate reductase
MPLKIAISGYGQMGKAIEKLCPENDIEVTNVFDILNLPNPNHDYDFEVVIDFTQPDTAVKNVETFAKMGKNIVLGTTGWYDKKEYIEHTSKHHNIGLIWGSNFSVGVNLFFKVIESASSLINNLDMFDAMIHEMHHKRKKDSPSGTAESIAEIVLQNLDRKTEIEKNALLDSSIKPEQLHVSSTRGGEITGRHTLYIDSIADSIELTHRAKNRSGFALGAILSAKWIADKKGMYEFRDVFSQITF